uniref:NAD(P)-binding domain-containing protein n=1 Tax=Bionectria ochroleuca TaxID=29856 RepID=A0A0B7KE14_BIOOC
MSISKVALVGANGNLGSVILPALVDAGFEVTIIQRSGSKSKPAVSSPNLKTKEVDGEFPLPDITAALKGQDAVIAAEPLRRLQLYRDKTKIRERCQGLTREFPDTFTWTALVCGHFFDWGLKKKFLHIDLDQHTALILDGGNKPASVATLKRVGEAVVRVLQRPEQTANRTLYIQSFNPTQRDVIKALERATGVEWTVEEEESGKFLDRHQKLYDEGSHEAQEDIVYALGALDADWTTRDGYAMELLGLENEDLDEVVGAILKEHAAQSKPTA